MYIPIWHYALPLRAPDTGAEIGFWRAAKDALRLEKILKSQRPSARATQRHYRAVFFFETFCLIALRGVAWYDAIGFRHTEDV
jgi:hypothetical protein